MSVLLFVSSCIGIRQSTKSNSKSMHKGHRFLRFQPRTILLPKNIKIRGHFPAKTTHFMWHCAWSAGVNLKISKAIETFGETGFRSTANCLFGKWLDYLRIRVFRNAPV